MPQGEEKFVDSGEDFHQIRCKYQIDGPVHLQVDGKVTPVVSIVVCRLAFHRPLLDFSLAVEVLYLGDESYICSAHFEVQIIRHLDGVQFDAILLRGIVGLDRIHRDLELVVRISHLNDIHIFIEEVNLLGGEALQADFFRVFLFISVGHLHQRFIVFLALTISISDVNGDVFMNLG